MGRPPLSPPKRATSSRERIVARSLWMLPRHGVASDRTAPRSHLEAHSNHWQQQNGPEYLNEAIDFVAQGKVKTLLETYPLAAEPKAYDRVAQGKARFRAVLTM